MEPVETRQVMKAIPIRTVCAVYALLLFLMVLTGCMRSIPEVMPPVIVPTLESSSAPPTEPSLLPPAEIGSLDAWIEVDLAKQIVILHEGALILAEVPASTGVTSDPKYATPPGLYRVESKDKGPVESVPGVYVNDLIMFDTRNGNGIHSRPMDAAGNLLDATLGKPATAGCVRVGESSRVFEFAQAGMWVWIH